MRLGQKLGGLLFWSTVWSGRPKSVTPKQVTAPPILTIFLRGPSFLEQRVG